MYRPQPSYFLSAFTDKLVAAAKTLDLGSAPQGSAMSPAHDTLRVFEPLLAGFWIPGRWQYCTIVSLYPSAQIVAHTDPPIVGIRYHIPIQTNPGCWVFSAGTWQQLELGRAYTMDPTEVHGAVNWGAEVRLHLLIDLER